MSRSQSDTRSFPTILWISLYIFFCYPDLSLHQAATSGDAESIRLLTADGFSPVDPVADYLRTTPLLIAAEQRHVEALTALLDAGADINYVRE